MVKPLRCWQTRSCYHPRPGAWQGGDVTEICSHRSTGVSGAVRQPQSSRALQEGTWGSNTHLPLPLPAHSRWGFPLAKPEGCQEEGKQMQLTHISLLEQQEVEWLWRDNRPSYPDQDLACNKLS